MAIQTTRLMFLAMLLNWCILESALAPKGVDFVSIFYQQNDQER
jgi:hypothetical protein